MYCDFKFSHIIRDGYSTTVIGSYFYGDFVDDGEGGTVYARSARISDFQEYFYGDLSDDQIISAMKSNLSSVAADNSYVVIPDQA